MSLINLQMILPITLKNPFAEDCRKIWDGLKKYGLELTSGDQLIIYGKGDPKPLGVSAYISLDKSHLDGDILAIEPLPDDNGL